MGPFTVVKVVKCGSTGHWSRECPNAQSSNDNKNATTFEALV